MVPEREDIQRELQELRCRIEQLERGGPPVTYAGPYDPTFHPYPVLREPKDE